MDTPTPQSSGQFGHFSQLRARIRARHRADEDEVVQELLRLARFTPAGQYQILERARPLVAQVRAERNKTTGIDAFLNTYDLSSREGIVLMCMAEALLRIPDAETVDRLIKDKIGATAWAEKLGASHSLFVNASTWALMLTGRIINLGDEDKHPGDILGEAARTSEDALRYYESYTRAIAAIGQAANGLPPLAAPSISVKLSAL